MLFLWGLDGRMLNYGVIDNLFELEVDVKIVVMDIYWDIVGMFVFLIKFFVKGVRLRYIFK